MKRIAIMATLVAVAACSKGDKSAATDTTSAGGAVAPASDSTGAMSNSSGTMGGSSMSADSSKGVQNQSQSGMTDSSGKSTLGPNATRLSPDQPAPVTAKGDTLKKKTP